jgi:predicted nucleic acid-binding Zn ribbon protein
VNPSLRTRVLRDWQPHAGVDAFTLQRVAPLSHLVPQVMKDWGLEQRLHQSQLVAHWTEIVGNELARHAQPVSLRKKVLTVGVDHPIWLQELSRYHKPLLLKKVNDRLGKNAVRNIVFRIG